MLSKTYQSSFTCIIGSVKASPLTYIWLMRSCLPFFLQPFNNLSRVFSCYSGPREDATRIGSAGVVRRQAVDISPLRRVNQAIYLLTTGARESAFRNIKTIAECLADELINAAKGSSNR